MKPKTPHSWNVEYPRWQQASNPFFDVVIVADVLFGSPRDNCAGNGLCKVLAPVASELPTWTRWNCKKGIAVIRLINHHMMVFHFVKASLCKQLEATYFSRPLFEVHELVDVKLNNWSTGSYQLLPGRYIVKSQGSYYTATMNIKAIEQRKSEEDQRSIIPPIMTNSRIGGG